MMSIIDVINTFIIFNVHSGGIWVSYDVVLLGGQSEVEIFFFLGDIVIPDTHIRTLSRTPRSKGHVLATNRCEISRSYNKTLHHYNKTLHH